MRGKSLTAKQADEIWAAVHAIAEKYSITPYTVVRVVDVRLRGMRNGAA